MAKCCDCPYREACSEIEQELSCEQVLALLDRPSEEEINNSKGE